MSEALLLAIITPIAATISALILKVWEAIAKSKQQAAEDARTLKQDYRDERDAALERVEKAEAEAQKWKADYWELYPQFYLLRLSHAQATQDTSSMNAAALGVAPHERRQSLSFLDKEKDV